METAVIGPVTRGGRKRKISDVQNETVGVGGRRKVMHTRSFELVGRYVQKDIKGSGVLLGRILDYDSGLYRIKYEDGRCEDVISRKVKAILVEDGDLTNEWLQRKETLNELLLNEDENLKAATADDSRELEKTKHIDSSSLSGADDALMKVHNAGNNDGGADSSIDSCEGARENEARQDLEASLVPPPELPPSSGHIGIPEEYVSHLFSVYSFLRSFSVRLFLYPFELDDFVGALNCSMANTLLNSVHVALMCFLKRQFEKLPSDGSELASKVLSCLNWSLLDTLTWPVYLVHYLMAMGYKKEDDWKEFYAHCLQRDYYTLSVGKKLIILQILCDSALDTEELRAEIDMREASEVGMNIDAIYEPERVHLEYSKSSDYKDIEATETVENHQTTYSLGNHHVESQVGSTVEDDYGDECRLCGMDGVLICCDGCPSAYHSRCLGLNKMPNGSWHCPECKVNASNSKFLRKTALRGGNVFGVDPYGQVFVASCDHLLILKASMNSESCLRYYNRRDIPGVLNALNAKPEYAILYSEICKGLMQYWEFSADILPTNKVSGIALKSVNNEGSSLCIAQLINKMEQVPEMPEVENNGTCASGTSAETVGSLLRNSVKLPVLGDIFVETEAITDCHGDSTSQLCGIMKTTMTKPRQSSSLIGQPANYCTSNQQSNSNMTEAVSTRSSNISSVNKTLLELKGSLVSQELNGDGNAFGSPSDWCLYMGSSFNRTGYINLYLHGDFSASAAANLAILSRDENPISECHSSDNHQNVINVSIALQMKAFASSAVQFFWPNLEKKLAEVPRERCSWCFSCKAPTTSKRGCLLNAAAASNSTRGAMKVLAGVRPVNNDRLSGIGTYIMFMEERLSGLLVGPFLNDTFRKQWRRQLEQATTCSEIKILLLELEENIRSIAFSADWMKLVECSSTQSSTSQIAIGSTQKGRPGRRGKKQPNTVEVVSDGSKKKLTDFTWWRGGIMSMLMVQRGILPSSIIQKIARQGGKKKIFGVRYVEGNEIPRISRQLIWRSAVEISGTVAHLALQVRYLDAHVRWGDLVRPDLMPSDEKSSEADVSAFRNGFICGKKMVGQEVRYCVSFGSRKHLPSRVMKNITEIEQILKDGKESYWFSETFIPLYLTREYEQKVEKNKSVTALSKLHKRQLKASRENIFTSLLWKQGNAPMNCCSCHQDVFYRNAAKCHACQGFCHLQCATSSTVSMSEKIDFLVICKQCCETQVATQVGSKNGSLTKPLLLQRQDIQTQVATQVGSKNGSLTKPLLLQRQDIQTQVATQVGSKNGSLTKPLILQRQDIPDPAIAKDASLVLCKGSSTSFGSLEHFPEVKSINRSAATKKNTKSNWGLIWRKKNYEDTGFDFRLRNILLRGNGDSNLIKPLCHLCDQPYNADLMYIRCETCKNWFHADSVELDESKIFSLVGFKCCRCRRIKSPVCPYSQKKNVLQDSTEHPQASKLKISAVRFNRSMILDHHRGGSAASKLPGKAEVIHVSATTANNPLFDPPYEPMPCTDGKSEGNGGWENTNLSPGPRKLPVRRHVSQETDVICQAGDSLGFEANAISSTEEMCISRSTGKESNLATNSFRDEVTSPASANSTISVQGLLPSLLQQLDSDNCFDLETIVGGRIDGKEPPESATKDKKVSSPVPENVTPKVSNDEKKLIRSTDTSKQIVPCKFCSLTEPWPDLSCQICGIWIHKTCSPWLESSCHEDGWRCGSCRDWC